MATRAEDLPRGDVRLATPIVAQADGDVHGYCGAMLSAGDYVFERWGDGEVQEAQSAGRLRADD